ncbi:MAG TPA: hypothetical protein VFG62_18290 [Rhodopila sp.]|jgi:hypothetical protein|nr:hypothetical protein [Rhodopila sp.]
MLSATDARKPPYTQAVRKVLQSANVAGLEADLLFLEAWEMQPIGSLAATLRASQIRRANPGLAEEISQELKRKS